MGGAVDPWLAGIDELWSGVGVEAAWQVTDLMTGSTLGQRADQRLPIVSITKVVCTLVMYRLAERGLLDPARPVRLTPDGRTRGTTGVSAMHDAVTLSLRDAAYLALTISDNAAGDAVHDAVAASVAGELAGLGLMGIHVGEPMRDLYDRLESPHVQGDPFAAESTSTGSPSALIELMRLLWTDRAASPATCAVIRSQMARQVWRHRLASGFPAGDIVVAGKTATAGPMRHEVGVVTFPGQRHYAVAVLTHSLSPIPDPRADAMIGEVARRAVRRLRRGGG